MVFFARALPLLATSLVAAALLAGCAAAPAPVATSPVTSEPQPSTSPSESPDPVPTPTQAAETGETMPSRVFDGACDAVYAASELSDILGETVTSDPQSAWELWQAGGVNCLWHTESYSTLVNFDLVPRDAVTSTEETAKCKKGEAWECTVEHEQNGIRVSGFFNVPGTLSKAKANAALDAVLSLFDQRATPGQAAPAPIPAADAWTNPVDCAALGKTVDLKPVFNNTPGFDWYASGGDAFPSPARMELWGDTYGLSCTWGTNRELSEKQLASGMATTFSVQVYGGAGWAQDEFRQQGGATDVEVAGFDRVIRVKRGSGDSTQYHFLAVHGPNVLRFSLDHKKLGNAAQAITLIAAELDER